VAEPLTAVRPIVPVGLANEVLPLPTQLPDTEKHPPARSMPRANVDVAAVPVTFRYVDWTPPVKVEVAGEPNVAAPVVPLKARAATEEVAPYVEVAK